MVLWCGTGDPQAALPLNRFLLALHMVRAGETVELNPKPLWGTGVCAQRQRGLFDGEGVEGSALVPGFLCSSLYSDLSE